MANTSQKALPIFIILAVIVGFILLFSLFTYSNPNDKKSVDSLAKESQLQQVGTGLTVDAVYLPQSETIEVWLDPHDDVVQFNTMAISLVLTGDALSAASNRPDIGSGFTGGTWSTPFSEVEETDANTLTFNVSLINSSPELYSFNQKMLLASFPINISSPESLSSQIDSSVSNYFDGSISEFHFSNSGLNQQVEVQ